MERLTGIILLIAILSAPVLAQDEAAALFNSKCANCHNANGDGKTAAAQKMRIPDLRSSEVQSKTDEEIYQTIGNGAQHKQYPHTFLGKGMTPAQVRMMVAHVRLLKGKS